MKSGQKSRQGQKAESGKGGNENSLSYGWEMKREKGLKLSETIIKRGRLVDWANVTPIVEGTFYRLFDI